MTRELRERALERAGWVLAEGGGWYSARGRAFFQCFESAWLAFSREAGRESEAGSMGPLFDGAGLFD